MRSEYQPPFQDNRHLKNHAAELDFGAAAASTWSGRARLTVLLDQDQWVEGYSTRANV
jgi:hypothetical protein